MKTMRLFFCMLIFSISWMASSASNVHVYLNDTYNTEYFYFCNGSVDSVIVHKPNLASSTIMWDPPTGPNIHNVDTVIITYINTGSWFFYSDEVDKYFHVYFTPSPPIEPVCMANDTSFCTGTFSLPLDAQNHLPGGYASTYLWSTGATTRTITATTPGTYAVTITNECGVGVYDITVTQYNPNAPHLGADQTFCWGSTSVLDPESTNVATYQWSTGESTPTITVDTTGSYWVYLVDNNGCSGADTILITALIPTPEDICFVEFDTVSQKNQIIWTSDLPDNTEQVVIYKETALSDWTFIGTVSSEQNDFVDLQSNPAAQSYSYRLATIDTCGNESEMSAHHTTITLLSTYDLGTDTYGFTWSAYQGLTVSIYYLYGIKADHSIDLIGSVPGNQFMYNYLNPDEAYVRYFVAFETPECGGAKDNVLVKSNWVQSVLTGIDTETAMQFAFYPNPADESITIRTSQTDYKVSIYTLTGQQIIRKTNSSTIDISDIAAGTYIVLFKSGDTLSRRKLVVE